MTSDTARVSALTPSLSPSRLVVLIGNYPPRRCGIATFAADIHAALLAAEPQAEVRVVAMVDPDARYDFPSEVVLSVPQGEDARYRDAARRINRMRPDVVCVQHEYGIFGGAAGERLLDLLDELDAPAVVTLHTVLAEPDPDQKRVLQALGRRASALVVMAERGVEMLRSLYRVDPDKIVLIPHGAPDRPLADPAAARRSLGLGEAPLLFSFGLLSPNKGLEGMVEALPAIVSRHPRARYLVLGATHPHLVAREGEAYRERLRERAHALGVGDNLLLQNRYAETEDLLSHLAAADVYVTPYLNAAQITSGTLSYALALGRPIVSTPYWHAQELLGGGRGVLVPFGDSSALAREVGGLLSDEGRRATLSARAYAFGRTMTWSRVAQRYLRIFDRVAAETKVVALRRAAPERRPAPRLQGVRRLTDDCGMLQHGAFEVADRNHGYCLDDNARALMLTVGMARRGGSDAELQRLASTYAAFVHHAWNEGAGRFRNFMGYDRRWMEAVGSQDSNGRTLWALAVAAGGGPGLQLQGWASSLVDRVLPHLTTLNSPRAQAFAILGACALLERQPDRRDARALAARFAADLQSLLQRCATAQWCWFEEVLAYDNARLPHALIRAGMALERADWVDDGLRALDWLCGQQLSPAGRFRPVGSDSFGRVRQPPSPYDQQPLEASATVDACLAAWEATGDAAWRERALLAYAWFLDGNDLEIPVGLPESGLCYDGLTPYGVNLNQGAESILAFQAATLAIASLEAVVSAPSRAASAAGVDLTPGPMEAL